MHIGVASHDSCVWVIIRCQQPWPPRPLFYRHEHNLIDYLRSFLYILFESFWLVYQYVHTCRHASYLLQVIMQRQISVKYARYMRVWLFVYSDEREFLYLNNLRNCKLHSPKLLENNILKNKQYKQTAQSIWPPGN